jgi:hypothetical protein
MHRKCNIFKYFWRVDDAASRAIAGISPAHVTMIGSDFPTVAAMAGFNAWTGMESHECVTPLPF